MTNVQLSDELAQKLVVMTGQPDADAAVMKVIDDFIRYQQQLRVLDFEGAFDADPTYDYKAQRRVP